MGRFLLIGIDGAEPSLVQQWIEAGHLPNLAALRDRGGLVPMASTMPPATFPAWTSCVTGVNPGRHGVFDFTEMIPGQYAVRFVNATYRRVPALWNILSDAGKRVAVLGVPATYPPEPVNGCMLSGFDSPVATRVDPSFVYPPKLYPDVRDWRFADLQETDVKPGWHARALPKLLDKIRVKTGIAAKLMAREPWDFFMIVFSEADTVGHHFWLFHDPESPRRHQSGPADALRQVYQALDQAIGVLVDTMGDASVAVVSDHGFGGAGTGVLHLNNWLAEKGYLRFAGGGGSLLKSVALKATPQRMRGALFRRFTGLVNKAESRSRFGGIDWAETRAWSEELNYFPSIRVNLEGREPKGQVKAAEYDAFCQEICACLETWEPIRKAWRREELYTGEYVDRAPDIVLELELEHGYSYSCLRSRGGPSFRRLRPEEYLGAKGRGMNGTHRRAATLLLSEPTSCETARLEDIAPTVLGQMGVAGPPMDGHSLLREGATSTATEKPPSPKPYDKTEERAIEERLRSLGYFE